MIVQRVILNILMLFFQHSYLLSYLGGIAGEEPLLFLVFISSLSSQTTIPIWIMILFGIAGILTFDSALFLFSRTDLASYIFHRARFIKKYAALPQIIGNLEGKYHLLTMMFSKFIFSVRIPLVAYLSRRGMKYKKFIFYDIISVTAWGVIMIPLAWLAGRGFSKGLGIAEDAIIAVSIALMFVAIVYLLNRLIMDEILIKRGLVKNKFGKRE